MATCKSLNEGLFEAFNVGKSLRGKGYCGRFAPSPTGPLHLGNLRTALVSWLKARMSQGKWLLRIDDLDTPRNRPGAIESIQNDLLWLGLSWDDQVVFQSQRIDLYVSALSFFKSQGKIFACQCTRKTLDKDNNTFGEFITYSGKCKNLGLDLEPKKDQLTSWRLKVNKKFSRTAGDLIVRRSDGFIAYHLATVVDELTLGINEVIRGNDLNPAMYVQLAIF